MLKNFDEMRQIDISKYVKQRDGFDYLNWAKCIDLLHENGAEKVYFMPLTNDKGSSLFMSDLAFAKDDKAAPNRCYEVAVKVVIDDYEFTVRGPVMNGANPVRDNSMSQQRVWNAQTRAFVKGVAIHTGLGFDLWCKSEQKEEDDIPKEEDLNFHNLMKIKTRITNLITEKCQKFDCDYNEIAIKVGFSSYDEMRAIVNYCHILERFEKKLKTL